MMSFFADLEQRNVFRVAAAYLVVAWLIVQVVETVFPAFGYGDESIRNIVIALGVAFIPVLVFAWIFELTPEGLKKEKDIDRSQSIIHTTGRKLDFVIIGLLIVALGYFAFDKIVLDPKRDALATVNTVAGLAEVRDLVGEDRYADAYARARELDPIFTDESLRQQLWSAVSLNVGLTSAPPGADVWTRPYISSEDDREHLGRTPMDAARLPLGMPRLTLELDGYRTLHVAKAMSEWWMEDITYRLEPLGSVPDDMVRVQGGSFEVYFPGFEIQTIELPDFLIDTTEVTNRQYQRFVDAGGYSDPKYWKQPFVKAGRRLTVDGALKMFVDQTGRPGPSHWEVGRYPDGMADNPVGGISWYEAAAYARFAGKQLPTLYHWYWAAKPYMTQFMVPLSNFGGEGTAPVGTFAGTSLSETYDMAGNVREWAWNQSGEGRFLLGGGWSDPEYMFTDANAQSPFDRNELNGIRLMDPLGGAIASFAYDPIEPHFRDYTVERPVSDEIFEVYRRLYAYDPTPLNADVVEREVVEHWTREKIELDAAYESERLTVFLYIPNDAEPPYTPIIYFPSSDAIYTRESPAADAFLFPFLIRSGHAVVIPVFRGTYERETALRYETQPDSNIYRDHVIQWSKDLGRSIDFLETRPDIAVNRIGYLSLSWGSELAPVMIAIEPRITASVLISGGMLMNPISPEVDPLNFLPRVRIPTRMINIPNDFMFSLKLSQKPFYEFLGADAKDHVLLEGGHIPPMNSVARETLDWFDQYLRSAPE